MLRFLDQVNTIVGMLLFLAYLYQVFYTLYGLAFCRRDRRKAARQTPAKPSRRYAALICARNEESVIGELISSLRAQDYPAELLDIYVLADNSTDATARVARQAGAIAFERFNPYQVGKGYALNELFSQIRSRRPLSDYDAFLVFDADNIVDSHFVSAMDRTFAQGYDVLTSYRNSKNFASSWVSAGYSIWFLREARFLNYPRMKLHTNCAISGTGFLVSSKIIEENGGWPYHLLTEDIQFSTVCATKGWRIGYCDDAILYDEQPVTFSQSWRQRMRWAKGFYQVNAHCGMPLLRGCLRGPIRFSCYDMLMTVAPCTLLTRRRLHQSLLLCDDALPAVVPRPFHAPLRRPFPAGYADVELWRDVRLRPAHRSRRVAAHPRLPLKKVMYLPFFPLFMFSYIPITLTALLVHVEWKPIRHTPRSKRPRVTRFPLHHSLHYSFICGKGYSPP